MAQIQFIVTMTDTEERFYKNLLSYCELLEHLKGRQRKRVRCRLQKEVFTSLCQLFKQVVILSPQFFHVFFSPWLACFSHLAFIPLGARDGKDVQQIISSSSYFEHFQNMGFPFPSPKMHHGWSSEACASIFSCPYLGCVQNFRSTLWSLYIKVIVDVNKINYAPLK